MKSSLLPASLKRGMSMSLIVSMTSVPLLYSLQYNIQSAHALCVQGVCVDIPIGIDNPANDKPTNDGGGNDSGNNGDDGDSTGGDAGGAPVVDEGPVPMCNGLTATVYVNALNVIVGGSDPGDEYRGSLRGTNNNDVMVGTNGADEIDGRGGNDIICGRGGDDEIEGGAGNDIIYGEAGNDSIEGDDGLDLIFGNDGDDSLEGGT
ncbi:hypothetical protein KKC44_06315, partial [Patescibacteria group bacterium]|nr:hypothetical protein [Patescibacteria group bacterium]